MPVHYLDSLPLSCSKHPLSWDQIRCFYRWKKSKPLDRNAIPVSNPINSTEACFHFNFHASTISVSSASEIGFPFNSNSARTSCDAPCVITNIVSTLCKKAFLRTQERGILNGEKLPVKSWKSIWKPIVSLLQQRARMITLPTNGSLAPHEGSLYEIWIRAICATHVVSPCKVFAVIRRKLNSVVVLKTLAKK